ncbi:hypothetical protein PENSPDRAFT_219050 [Peniophora sp. CONT]|nr:hypothetical protein PENSPDRAFT_219050 [Peniophora sp. CONT]
MTIPTPYLSQVLLRLRSQSWSHVTPASMKLSTSFYLGDCYPRSMTDSVEASHFTPVAARPCDRVSSWVKPVYYHCRTFTSAFTFSVVQMTNAHSIRMAILRWLIRLHGTMTPRATKRSPRLRPLGILHRRDRHVPGRMLVIRRLSQKNSTLTRQVT